MNLRLAVRFSLIAFLYILNTNNKTFINKTDFSLKIHGTGITLLFYYVNLIDIKKNFQYNYIEKKGKFYGKSNI